MQWHLLSKKNLTLEKVVTLVTAMEMVILEPLDKNPNPQPSHYQKQGLTKRDCCGKQGHSPQCYQFQGYQYHKCGKVGLTEK